MNPGKLYFGDNLSVLRDYIAADSIDLVYLDPPFNSQQDYNVLFKERDLTSSSAQLKAFEDCWHWDQNAQTTYEELVAPDAVERGIPPAVSILMEAFYKALPQRSDMTAYLVMMAPRLVELRRVLTPSGSLYLHCDPTASHYLKMLLDAIFGAQHFFSEIVWKRYGAHGNASRYGAVHDVLLFYGKSKNATFNKQFVPYSQEYTESRFRLVDENGRQYQEQNLSNPSPRPNLNYPYKASNGVTYHPHPNGWKCDLQRMKQLDVEGRLHFPKDQGGRLRLKMYLDESEGVPLQDVWTDIQLPSTSKERIGYPTQKPLALLERIIKASSNDGDIVLDPFCGCGTAVEAAQRLGREWIGIDITHLAITVVRDRLASKFPGVEYELLGEPQDVESARVLAETSPYQFQWWAVHRVGAHPIGGTPGSREGKRGRDRGIDGMIKFRVDPDAGSKVYEIVVSVKSGRTVTPAMVRELRGTMERDKAAMGVLLTMQDSTREMRTEAARAGMWTDPRTGQKYARLQILSAGDIFSGKTVAHPGVELATRSPAAGETLPLPGMALPPAPPRKGMLIRVPEKAAQAPTPIVPIAAERDDAPLQRSSASRRSRR